MSSKVRIFSDRNMVAPARKSRVRQPAAAEAAAENQMLSENTDPNVAASLARPLHVLAEFPIDSKRNAGSRGGGGGKPGKKSPVLKKSASMTPRSGSRKRFGSFKYFSTPAYDAPRAPLWDFSEEREKIRAKLSSPVEAEQDQELDAGDVGERSRGNGATGKVLEEAMNDLPEPGEGRVRFLVDAFERLVSLSGNYEGENRGRRRQKTKTTNSASSPRAEEINVSYPSIASSSKVFFPVGASKTGSSDRSSISVRDGWQKSRCNSMGSSERSCSKNPTSVTIQRPFKLRTEQRGKVKEENLIQRVRKTLVEEEKLRTPLAQGLPWTSDEPKNPVKPPTKEPTEPIDVVLHSDVRAVGRAEFDHQVAERISFLEQIRLEKEGQQKMEEEMEIKQLRKELVPRAQPMPDFAKPFVPKRSVKPQTVPKEPRFHRD